MFENFMLYTIIVLQKNAKLKTNILKKGFLEGRLFTHISVLTYLFINFYLKIIFFLLNYKEKCFLIFFGDFTFLHRENEI